jgi:hypothetical protein
MKALHIRIRFVQISGPRPRAHGPEWIAVEAPIVVANSVATGPAPVGRGMREHAERVEQLFRSRA